MKKLEEQAALAAAEMVRHFSRTLEAKGLTCSAPEVQVWDDSPHGYASELRVWVYMAGVPHDSLELHVYRDGQALVTADEVRKWFEFHLRALAE